MECPGNKTLLLLTKGEKLSWRVSFVLHPSPFSSYFSTSLGKLLILRKLLILLNRFIIFLIPFQKFGQLQEIGTSQRNKPKMDPTYVCTSSYLFHFLKKMGNNNILIIYTDLKPMPSWHIFSVISYGNFYMKTGRTQNWYLLTHEAGGISGDTFVTQWWSHLHFHLRISCGIR